MRSRGKLQGAVEVFLILCLVTGNLSAALLQVEDIQLPIPACWWYQHTGGENGYFYITNGSTSSAVMRTVGAPAYNYKINSGLVTISQSVLIDDLSSGGTAHGEFAGGATLTVEGTVENISTGETSFGIILEATMDLSALHTWELLEDGYENFDVSLNFTPTDGGLNMGMVVGSDTLIIGVFRADLSFQQCGPGGVDNFSSKNILGMANTIQITAIPEPATVLLLGFGTLLIYRRKSKS